jgi:hypothetical protein
LFFLDSIFPSSIIQIIGCPHAGWPPRQKEGMLARNNYSYQKQQKERAKKKKKEEKRQRKLNKENTQDKEGSEKEDSEQVS